MGRRRYLLFLRSRNIRVMMKPPFSRTPMLGKDDLDFVSNEHIKDPLFEDYFSFTRNFSEVPKNTP